MGRIMPSTGILGLLMGVAQVGAYSVTGVLDHQQFTYDMFLNQTAPAQHKQLKAGDNNITLFTVSSPAVGLLRYTNGDILPPPRLLEADFAWDLSGATPSFDKSYAGPVPFIGGFRSVTGPDADGNYVAIYTLHQQCQGVEC